MVVCPVKRGIVSSNSSAKGFARERIEEYLNSWRSTSIRSVRSFIMKQGGNWG